MSLLLDFGAATNLRIDGVLFGIGTFSYADGGCYVWADNAGGAHTQRYNDCNPVVRKEAPSGPVVDFGGPVWIDGWFSPLDSAGFVRGGYLEEVSHYYAFYGGGTVVQFDVKTLGVRPSPYQGGIRIDGLNFPAARWEDWSLPAEGQYLYGSTCEAFVLAGTRLNVTNWKSVGSTSRRGGEMKMDAKICGFVGSDIRWKCP